MNRKWEKDDKYIEIENVYSVDCGSAICVSSNAFLDGLLPIEWREIIPDSKPEEQKKLISSVNRWVKRNGFT